MYKSITASIVICLGFVAARAQYNPFNLVYEDVTESGASTSTRGFVCLEGVGQKHVNYDMENQQIILRNADFSLYKTINMPVFPWGPVDYIAYVSNTLFDTDASDIEFIVIREDYVNAPELFIYREDGTLLMHLPDRRLGLPAVEEAHAHASGAAIVNSTAGALMRVYVATTPWEDWHHAQYYTLPGRLVKCNCYCENNNDDVLPAPDVPEHEDEGHVYPNPVKSGESITYDMSEDYRSGSLLFYDSRGTHLKTFALRSRENTIPLDRDTFPAGSYFYQFESEGKAVGAKTLIVVN